MAKLAPLLVDLYIPASPLEVLDTTAYTTAELFAETASSVLALLVTSVCVQVAPSSVEREISPAQLAP
jgi:hypothetical protein